MAVFGTGGNLLRWIRYLWMLPRYLLLYVRLMGDVRVPLTAKLAVVGALAYLISPLDFMPDFLVPVLGQADDLLVLWLAFQFLVRKSPPEVVAEHSARRSGRFG
ncbi:MAG: YkvA family protein [Leptospirillia bacterium]